jgi:hypothetical protein
LRATAFRSFSKGKNMGSRVRELKIAALFFFGCLVISGCLPPKTVIELSEDPAVIQPGETLSEAPKASEEETRKEPRKPSEEEARLEQLIRKLEETEKRLLETQRRTEEALKKVEKASNKTEEAAGRIQRAHEKIEAVGQKAKP